MPRSDPLTVTIALGGNALLRRGEKGNAKEQLGRVRNTAKELVQMIENGDRILITHGNGPQVGNILAQNEAAKNLAPQMPLDVCGAESQGMIGYMIQQALEGELRSEGLEIPVATVLTQVLVDPSDPAFKHPTKPIGPFYTRERSGVLKKEKGWKMVEDAGRGYRRVVPSPEPKDVVEKDAIERLFKSGVLVIAAGGGGIPVVRSNDGRLEGTEAVLDKDRTAALLATTLKTKILLILTDVDGVYLNYNTLRKQVVREINVRMVQRYLKDGQFPPGSMGPKMESAMSFLKSGGERAVIAPLEKAEEALEGKAGTTITD